MNAASRYLSSRLRKKNLRAGTVQKKLSGLKNPFLPYFITSHNIRYVKFCVVKSRGCKSVIILIVNTLQLTCKAIVNNLVIVFKQV